MLARLRTGSSAVLLLLAIACTPPATPAGPAAAPPSSSAAPPAPAAPPPASDHPGPATPETVTAPVGAVAQPTPVARRTVLTAYPALSLSAMSYMYAEDQGLYARYGVDAQSTGMVPQ